MTPVRSCLYHSVYSFHGVQSSKEPGRFRGRSPARTCRHTHELSLRAVASNNTPAGSPISQVRHFQGRGVGRKIALHTCQLLGPTVRNRDNSAVRSRRPAASEFASESHLRAPGGVSGPAGHPARGTRTSSRGSRVSMHNVARGQPIPSSCSRNPERPVAARRETPFLRKGDDAAFIPRRSCRTPEMSCVWDVHASLGLGRSLLPLSFDLEKSSDVVGARRMVRASRAHPTSSRHWSRIGMGLRGKFSPNPAHSDGKRASGCSHVTLSIGRPLPAYPQRLVSLQAACSLCHAYGMHASRRHAASGGTCVRHQGDHAI
jgi:hypothetical protein